MKAGAEDSAAVVNQQVGRQAGDGVLPDKLVVPSLEVAGLHPLFAVFPAGLEPVFAAGVEREIQHPEFFFRKIAEQAEERIAFADAGCIPAGPETDQCICFLAAVPGKVFPVAVLAGEIVDKPAVVLLFTQQGSGGGKYPAVFHPACQRLHQSADPVAVGVGCTDEVLFQHIGRGEGFRMALDKGFSLLAEEGCIILMAADAAQEITVVGVGPVTFCLRVAEASFQPDFPAFSCKYRDVHTRVVHQSEIGECIRNKCIGKCSVLRKDCVQSGYRIVIDD